MMGVYIKGIEMPTGNHEIIMRIQSDGCVLDQWGHRFNQEFIAVPVPPHGRLIDADALDNTLGIDDRDDYVHWTLDAAPTIIPAEETNKEATNDQNNS